MGAITRSILGFKEERWGLSGGSYFVVNLLRRLEICDYKPWGKRVIYGE